MEFKDSDSQDRRQLLATGFCDAEWVGDVEVGGQVYCYLFGNKAASRSSKK